MKKYFSTCAVIIMMAIISTSCGEKKLTPEEEVTKFGSYFLEKFRLNQIDSIVSFYPAITQSENYNPIPSDSISVSEETPGQYLITFSGAHLTVNRADDGTINVIESQGLFAFPEEKMELAKKSGMYDASLSDVQLSERMNDEEFFSYLKKKKQVNSSTILKKGQVVRSSEFEGYQTVTNLTDQPIKGSDYSVTIWEWEPPTFADYAEYGDDAKGYSSYSSKSGKDIPPHGSVRYTLTFSMRGGEEISKINLKIPQDELTKRFVTYSGNEYQEYLASKK